MDVGSIIYTIQPNSLSKVENLIEEKLPKNLNAFNISTGITAKIPIPLMGSVEIFKIFKIFGDQIFCFG